MLAFMLSFIRRIAYIAVCNNAYLLWSMFFLFFPINSWHLAATMVCMDVPYSVNYANLTMNACNWVIS